VFHAAGPAYEKDDDDDDMMMSERSEHWLGSSDIVTLGAFVVCADRCAVRPTGAAEVQVYAKSWLWSRWCERSVVRRAISAGMFSQWKQLFMKSS